MNRRFTSRCWIACLGVFLILLFVTAPAILAQQTAAVSAQSASNQSDPQALAVVENAITAMGGKTVSIRATPFFRLISRCVEV